MRCARTSRWLAASLLFCACGPNAATYIPPEDAVFGVDPTLRPYSIGTATQVLECALPAEAVGDLPDVPRLFLTNVIISAVLDSSDANELATTKQFLTIERGDEARLALLSEDHYDIGFSARGGVAVSDLDVPASVATAVQGCDISEGAVALGVEAFFEAKEHPADFGDADVAAEGFTGEPYYMEGAVLQVREDQACSVSRWRDETEDGSGGFREEDSNCIERENFERGVIRVSEM